MLSQFAGSTDFELSNLYTAERFLYIMEIAEEYRRIYRIGTELELVFSSTRQSYKPHVQPRVKPNSHNTLPRAKRSGSEISGQSDDNHTS